MELRRESFGEPAASSPLEEYLRAHLHVERARLNCHVLTDRYVEADWATEALPSPCLSPTEYLQTRHLVLLSQSQALGSPDKRRIETPPVTIVMGLCVVEYALRRVPAVVAAGARPGAPSRCYIQYVDTTGLIRPRSIQGALTRSLLKAYVRYARDVLGTACIHLFAAPKPSLLFAGSEVHGKKAVLGGRHLVSWWLVLLREALLDSAQAQVFAFAPGEELLPLSARHTRQCVEKLCTRLPGGNLAFVYGIPYEPGDLAASHIPAFQDDPKWRHLEALTEGPLEQRARKRQRREQPALTVREFFETLSYRSDFVQEGAALLCACFSDPHGHMHAAEEQPAARSEAATCVLRVLQTLTFESEQEALRSSARLLAMLRVLGIPGFPLSDERSANENHDENGQCGEQQRFRDLLALLQPADHGGAHARVMQPVSDLQSFVKRKIPRGSNNNNNNM